MHCFDVTCMCGLIEKGSPGPRKYSVKDASHLAAPEEAAGDALRHVVDQRVGHVRVGHVVAPGQAAADALDQPARDAVLVLRPPLAPHPAQNMVPSQVFCLAS